MPHSKTTLPTTNRLLQAALVMSVFIAVIFIPAALAAQDSDADQEAMASWVALDVTSGYETRVASDLAAGMSGWTVDQWGNLVKRVGSGSPRRVVACALDRPGYAVTQITDDGYLRVHRIGSRGGSRHPLWDQAFEAQQVRILTEQGPVAGVVARSNGHFAQQHRDETWVVRADDLWVDVGAESADGVAELGIGLLDPVSRHLPPWTISGAVAGPDAGRRVGCAAVAALAEIAERGDAAGGETHFVLSSQEVFGWVGLSSLIARGGQFDGVILVAPGQSSRVVEERPARSLGRAGAVLSARGLSSLTWIAPEVGSPGSHMETIRVEEALAVLSATAAAAGMSLPTGFSWVPAPAPAPLRTGHMDVSLTRTASVLEALIERHGVSGHEWSVRRFVLESLPEWARDRAVVDDIGNIMVAVGPERDTTVFMAHMDEVGYEVGSIAPDGIVTLARKGEPTSSAWEGQTALVHFDPAGAPSTRTGDGTDIDPRWKAASLSASAPEPLRGVFQTRYEADERTPGTLTAWFGLNGAALLERGVGVGAMVTSHKEGLRMGPTRFTGRGLDDRAGTTAMILAVNDLNPDRLQSKVIFAWSVHEQGVAFGRGFGSPPYRFTPSPTQSVGLQGARAMARRFAATTRRIYSVDTFVTSDTPLESPHFAYAPLGNGPVLKAIHSSSISPDRERARVKRIAAAAGIPLQMALVQGSTDGVQFTFWGAPNQGLSWPSRYSYSPGETLDLRDLTLLAELIAAVATEP